MLLYRVFPQGEQFSFHRPTSGFSVGINAGGDLLYTHVKNASVLVQASNGLLA